MIKLFWANRVSAPSSSMKNRILPAPTALADAGSGVRLQALRWLFGVTGPLLLILVCVPARAAHYNFPGKLPEGCTGSKGSYTCGALALDAGDTISIGAPATIIVNGAFTTGAGTYINAGGTASDLSFAVSGTTHIGTLSDVTANIVGVGVVTLGALVKLKGNISTQSAAINIGDFNTINGSLSTAVAGVVNVGANSRVTGSISTLSGAINIGANTTIDGSLSSSLAGVITIGAGAKVGGNISTVSGAINLGAGSNVIGYVLSTIAGAITLGDKATVGGNIASNSGAITIGTGSSAGGSVCTGLAGAITLNDNTSVGGNITTNAGAITVGDLSQVAGSINAVVGAVTVASSSKVGKYASKIECQFDPRNEKARAAPSVPVIKSREWRQLFMR